MAAAEAAGLGKAPGAKQIFTGFGLGLLYKTLNVAFRGWKDIPERIFNAPFKGGSISAEISPELLGVGYIIGPYVAGIMCAGGALSYWVLIPAIKFFGDGLPAPLAPGRMLIEGQHRPWRPTRSGAPMCSTSAPGAVAAGGLISMLQAMPSIWRGLKASFKDVKSSAGHAATAPGTDEVPRTERDPSMKVVAIGIIVLITGIVLAPSLHMNLLGALLIVVFGFLFVTVSSRLGHLEKSAPRPARPQA